MILAVFESPPVTLGGSFSSSSASTNQSRPTSRLVTDNAKAKAKPPPIDIDSGSETEYDSDDLELYSQQATKKKSEAAAATKGKEKEVAAAAKEDEGGKEDVGGWIYMGKIKRFRLFLFQTYS
jgi:NACalpha-BTF3-like transcription factor